MNTRSWRLLGCLTASAIVRLYHFYLWPYNYDSYPPSYPPTVACHVT